MLYIFPLMLHFDFYFRVNGFLCNPSHPLTGIPYYPLEETEGGQGLSVEDQLL